MTTCVICGTNKKPEETWPAYNLCMSEKCFKETQYRRMLTKLGIPIIL